MTFATRGRAERRLSATRLTAFLLAATAVATMPCRLFADSFEASLTRGEAAWDQRAEGHMGNRAQAGPIDEAITAFEEALEARPEDLPTRARLLHALYFKGDHVLTDKDELLELFTRGRDLADEGREMLATAAGLPEDHDEMEPEELAGALADQPDAVSIYFWAGVHWGRWATYRGKIAAARQGVAKKIRDYAQVVILLDETYEMAGGHRVLGRLHTEAPRLPFVTGWVDRDSAVTELERAVELAPDDLMNRLYLADALLRFRKQERQIGLTLLRELAASEPSVALLVEDAQVIADARELLEDES